MIKKQLIIKAFEQLDVGMLNVLLNDDMSYQDVPKYTFVNALKKYFFEARNYDDTKLDFKAYKGKCDGCQKGKTGYSFVNSQGECFGSFVFEEEEDDFTDIYSCSIFKNENIEILNKWLGIYFYEDEKTDFIHTSQTLQEEKECLQGEKEIEREMAENGVLCSNFYLQWYSRFEHLNSMKRLFNKKNYKFTIKIGNYLSAVSSTITAHKRNLLAKELYLEFLDFPIITEEKLKDWLIKADYEFRYAKYGFEENCHFREDYFEDRYFRYQLSEVYYYHIICELLNKYFDWIPEKNPLDPIDEHEDDYSDDEDLPF